MDNKMSENYVDCNLRKEGSTSNKSVVQKCKVQFCYRLRKTQNKCGKFLI